MSHAVGVLLAPCLKLMTVGSQPVSLQGGLRYWADSPDSGPEGLGFRVSVTLLFPG